MVCRKQDAAPRIDVETPHPAGHATGKSQLAWGIKEKKHAFADAVTLAARPQANPLRDGQILSRDRSANRVVNVEGDGDGFHRLTRRGGTPLDSRDGPGKNSARRARNHRQPHGARWRYG